MGVLPNARPRIVIGTMMKLIIRAALAIVTALALPNRSPRIAGPMNGTAGADAVRAANTLSLNEKRNTRRNSRNTRAYKPTIAVNIATINAISWTRSARGVPTVPTKSASGTAYNNTMRLRTDASFGPKSWRHAATKPSSRVKTIGASAVRMVCTMVPLRLRDYADDAFQCGDYSRILRRAEWGSAIVLWSRKSRRRIDQAARPPPAAGISPMWLVCATV